MFNYNGHSKDGGVYVIFNKLKWRLYVGSAAGFQKRWWQHIQALRGQRHINKFLQADFNQCGEAAFEFHVLEVVNAPRDERLAREQHWLDIHFDNGKQCYNLRKEAVSREGSKAKNPEETRRKQSEAMKRLGIKPPDTTGTKRSAETRAKMSAAQIGRKKPPLSEEHKRKLSEAGKGNTNGLGYKHTEDAKCRISEAVKRRYGFA